MYKIILILDKFFLTYEGVGGEWLGGTTLKKSSLVRIRVNLWSDDWKMTFLIFLIVELSFKCSWVLWICMSSYHYFDNKSTWYLFVCLFFCFWSKKILIYRSIKPNVNEIRMWNLHSSFFFSLLAFFCRCWLAREVWTYSIAGEEMEPFLFLSTISTL